MEQMLRGGNSTPGAVPIGVTARRPASAVSPIVARLPDHPAALLSALRAPLRINDACRRSRADHPRSRELADVDANRATFAATLDR